MKTFSDKLSEYIPLSIHQLTGPVSAGLAFVILNTVTPVAAIDTPGQVRFAFASLIVGLFLDRVVEIFKSHGDRQRRDEQIRKLEDTVAAHSSMEILSGEDALFNHLRERLNGASEVRNTFISYGQYAPDFDADSERTVALYRTFFAHGGISWTDIVGMGDFFGARYTKLSDVIRKKTKHVIKATRHTTPAINFCVIDYAKSGLASEVVIARFRSSAVNQKRFFVSRNPEIVDLFNGYFKLMEAYCDEVVELNYADKDQRTISQTARVANRAGRWATTSFRREGRECILQSVGLIDIKFRDYNVDITGLVLWDAAVERMKHVETVRHDAKNTSYTKTAIFFEYGDSETGERGVCVYKFERLQGVERMTGYLQDETGNRIQLAGIKIAGSGNIDALTVQGALPEFKRVAAQHNLAFQPQAFKNLLDQHPIGSRSVLDRRSSRDQTLAT